jgi:MFS family permease
MFRYMFLTARFSPQMEVHAAGSALVLAGIAGAGLIAGSRARRAGAWLLVAFVAVGLWTSGSRLAIVSGVATGAIVLGWWGVRSSRRRAMVAVAATMVVLAAGWFAVVPKTPRYSEMSVSLRTRIMMAEAAMRLFSTAPVLGIGIDQFYGASVRALDPEFPALSGYSRENAHNNFLQVLTEQGVVGLAAMLWWLGLIGAGAWAAWRHSEPSRARNALALGLLACVATWIGGHPLLVREFSTIFFFYAAILAAMTPAASAIHSRVAAAAIAILLLTLPVRAIVLRNQAWLENQGFGLSRWTHDSGYPYREAGAEFQIYLPTGRAVQLPLRLAAGIEGTGQVEVRRGEALLQTQQIRADQWRLVDIQMPQSRTQFETVRVTVSAVKPREGPVMLVGRMIQP